eukprot:1282508-Amphidinium_carterae.2
MESDMEAFWTSSQSHPHIRNSIGSSHIARVWHSERMVMSSNAPTYSYESRIHDTFPHHPPRFGSETSVFGTFSQFCGLLHIGDDEANVM